jgi:hypothetical protein
LNRFLLVEDQILELPAPNDGRKFIGSAVLGNQHGGGSNAV